jgi:hypothetical protein
VSLQTGAAAARKCDGRAGDYPGTANGILTENPNDIRALDDKQRDLRNRFLLRT